MEVLFVALMLFFLFCLSIQQDPVVVMLGILAAECFLAVPFWFTMKYLEKKYMDKIKNNIEKDPRFKSLAEYMKEKEKQ